MVLNLSLLRANQGKPWDAEQRDLPVTGFKVRRAAREYSGGFLRFEVRRDALRCKKIFFILTYHKLLKYSTGYGVAV